MKYWILAFGLFAANLHAQEEQRGEARKAIEPYGYIYGIGLGISREIYKGYDRRVIPLPIIGYRGEKLNVYGPFVSYDATQMGAVDVSLQVAPRFQGFDENDSDVFEGMEDRKFSMDAGIALSYDKHNWKTNVSAMFDVLGRSNGYELSMGVGRVFRFGPVFVEPSVSIDYLDDKHVDYYYGVRMNEATGSRAYFQGDHAVNYAVGLSVSTPIFFGGFTQLAFDHTWFDSSITDSPIVEDERNISFRLLFSKMF